MEESRFCSDCGIEKPLIAFGIVKGNQRRPECKECRNAMQRVRYREKNPPLTQDEHHAIMCDRTNKLWNDPVYRAKQSKTRSARIVSAETRMRMSSSQKLAWQSQSRRDSHAQAYARMTEEERRANTLAARERMNRMVEPTSIERMVGQVLTDSEIPYEAQAVISGFIVDFYIQTRNLIIECDGDYWHALPEVQKRDRMRDAVFKKRGYRIAHLPEHAIRKDATGEVKRALS